MKSEGDERKAVAKKQRKAALTSGATLGRRDIMKIGAGAVVTTLAGQAVAHAANAPAKPANPAARPRPISGGNPDYNWRTVTTGPGYKNEANRISGNGPMDNTSRQIVEYTRKFSESDLSSNLLPGIGTTLIDCLAAIVTGFESEPMRAGAKYASALRGDLKSTVFGYGIVTSPEAAALATSMGMRIADWLHSPDIVPGVLAVGEALHKTGPEVLTAIAVGMEVVSALGKAQSTAPVKLEMVWDTMYDGPATAMAVGKLLGLDEDRLANALSMSLVPQIPLFVSHVGALSHFKSCHSPWQVRAGVCAAFMASYGLTAPAQPFEERGGLWDSVTGPYKELTLPVNPGRLRAAEGLENGGYKRFPTDMNHHAMLEVAVPAIREWTKADDIASIHIEVPFGHWEENGDPPKWDPRNRETADHSMPFVVAYTLINGDLFLDAFTPKQFIENQQVRDLMNKITISGSPDFAYHQSHFTVRKKSGEEFQKDVYDIKPMAHDEVVRKYKRVCDFQGVSAEQRDRALDTWSNLIKVNDIGSAIGLLAKFGKPMPL